MAFSLLCHAARRPLFRALKVLIAASRVVRLNRPYDGDVIVQGIRRSANKLYVSLPLSPETLSQGEQSLFWADRKGHAVVSPIAETHSSVEYEVTRCFRNEPKVGDKAWLSGWLAETPEDLGMLNYETVELPNRTKAWLFQGNTTWVIHVHGRKAAKAETLRGIKALLPFGFTQLSISHESDPIPEGLGYPRSYFGVKESIQIANAVSFAESRGAIRIILYGWSLAGLFIKEYLANNQSSASVSAVILDSPLIDLKETLELQSLNAGLEEQFGSDVYEALSRSKLLKILGFARSRVPTLKEFSFNMPLLLMYSRTDGYVSMKSIDSISSAKLLTRVEFNDSRHCRLFNSDPEKYRSGLVAFMNSLEK